MKISLKRGLLWLCALAIGAAGLFSAGLSFLGSAEMGPLLRSEYEWKLKLIDAICLADAIVCLIAAYKILQLAKSLAMPNTPPAIIKDSADFSATDNSQLR